MKGFRFTIRIKLLLLSVLVLSIPYVGFEYLRELERYLRDALEISLTDATLAMAAPLHERADLFPSNTDLNIKPLYLHEFVHPMQLDGYTDDWLSYLSWSDVYKGKEGGQSGFNENESFRLILSQFEQYINVLLQVRDEQLVYQEAGKTSSTDNDHIILVFADPEGRLRRYYFSPIAPGSISPFQYKTYRDDFDFEYKTIDYATNIAGEFQQTKQGYNLEIRIPRGIVGERVGFIVANVNDYSDRKIASQIGTAGEHTFNRPGRLAQSSLQIGQILSNLVRHDGRRVWVLDNQGQVLASQGNLEGTLVKEKINFLYSLILPSVFDRFRDDLAGASRLQGQEVSSALEGRTESRWRSSPDGKAVIISVASPIMVSEDILGVVVVEETTNNIQMLQRQATASLFNKTLLVFILVTLLLLIFATRLSLRLRRLSIEAENATDQHGRVAGVFSPSNASDEIGELSRNYVAMLGRLQQYNQYLEGMAGKLSHELRTPITVVQSSLEHLQSTETVVDSRQYLERAREGIQRLNLLVVRLSEATRLEQALQTAALEDTNVFLLLGNYVEGYSLAYPDAGLQLSLPEQAIIARVAPDLIVQMLDKLVSNAMDFSSQDRPIEIKVRAAIGCWHLHIVNYGSKLPSIMEDQLFNSMVSVRDKGKVAAREPHLGLGLYVVRLIAEFHSAKVIARNIPEDEAVEFVLTFPA